MASKQRKPKIMSIPADDFESDAIMLRTSSADGTSYYGGFEWPRKIGAVVACPDWNSDPVCGGGLHGLLDGIGNKGLLSEEKDALWWIVGVRRDECVEIGGDKVKAPRAKVIYFGDFAGALSRVSKPMLDVILSSAKKNTTTDKSENAAATGYSGHAAATGDSGHAAATGDSGHAAATGYRGHAAATGYSGHAAATGYSGHAAVKGKNAIAASLGWNGVARAEAGGAIMLASYDYNGDLVAVFASLVGQNGIEAGKAYCLNKNGKPKVVSGGS